MANEKRLIDANAIEYFEHTECHGHGLYFTEKIAHKDDIDKMPTVDAVEVVRGKWKRSAFFGNHNKRTWEYFCSECKTLGSPQWKCCPVCTALMDGDGNA